MLRNHKLRCIFCHAVLRLLVFTAAATVPFSAWAQSGTARQLTLILPTDSQFDSVVTQNYPGLLQTLASYRTVRPFLVLLINQTGHSATAYSIEFNIQTPGAPQGFQFPSPPQGQQMRRIFMQGESGTKVDAVAFGPGEVRLVSPNFDVSPADYQETDGRFSVVLSQGARPPLPLSNPNAQVSSAVDSAIYDDGVYTGPDHSFLGKKYQAVTDAARDEGAAILKVTNPTRESILALLTQDAAPVQQRGTSDPEQIYRMTYALQRANTARRLMGRMQGGGGLEFVLMQARIMASAPQVSLSQMSQ